MRRCVRETVCVCGIVYVPLSRIRSSTAIDGGRLRVKRLFRNVNVRELKCPLHTHGVWSDKHRAQPGKLSKRDRLAPRSTGLGDHLPVVTASRSSHCAAASSDKRGNTEESLGPCCQGLPWLCWLNGDKCARSPPVRWEPQGSSQWLWVFLVSLAKTNPLRDRWNHVLSWYH